jgi:hypothetical protein
LLFPCLLLQPGVARPLTRRDLLAAGALALPGFLSTARANGKKPVLRAAHVTDVHITKDKDAPKGVAAMFAHLFGRNDWRPDVVLNTGDAVMAVDGRTTGAKAAEQIGLWQAAVKDCPVPIISCLGNHDVWDGAETIRGEQAQDRPNPAAAPDRPRE